MRQVFLVAAAAIILSWTGLAHAAQAATPNANEFKSEADAKVHCPSDQVVWANNNQKNKIYHPAGDKYYGTTKRGAFMCQKDSEAAGFRAAKPRRAKTVKAS